MYSNTEAKMINKLKDNKETVMKANVCPVHRGEKKKGNQKLQEIKTV